MQVAVVGAGVIGSSIAVSLIEKLSNRGIVVTLISDEFTPLTTSDKSGSIILPFDVRLPGQESDEIANDRIKKWTRETFQYLDALYNSEDASKVNLQLVNGYYANEEDDKDPWWSVLTPGFRRVLNDEMQRFRLPSNFKRMYSFNAYILGCHEYLLWLMNKFTSKGGIVEQRKVYNLAELSSYDVVINCTGLGAAELVNDRSVYPVRGDTVIVSAPWIKQFMFFIKKDELTYIFPRSDGVLLGGTKVPGDWSEEPNKTTAKEIIERCSTVIPSVVNAEVMKLSSGLRPARPVVRLEMDICSHSPLIHCYGHGGQGTTLHWGCALEVVNVVEQCLLKNKL